MASQKKVFMIAVALVLSLGLVGCGTQTPTTDNTSTPSENVSQTQQTEGDNTDTSSVEVISLTSQIAGYDGPTGTQEDDQPDGVGATITVDQEGIIQSVDLTLREGYPQSAFHQGNFKKAIATEVVGKPLETVSIGKVGGASNTSKAFNRVLDELRTQYAETTATTS